MNSTKLNMYAAGFIGSLLIFLLLGFFSDLLFLGGEEEEEGPLAFAVEVEGAEDAEDTAEATDWAALVAAANAGNGEKLFGKCKACHKVQDGVNGVGPSLWGVVGRDIASAEGYSYSEALTGLEGDWTLEALSGFLESPKGYAPGTKMGFGGLKKIGARVDLIVYLNEADGSPIELATASASEEAETEVAATAEPAAEASETASETTAAATGEDSFSELLANADAEAGKKVFGKCKACHKVVEGKNGVGPSLWGVIGRDAGSVEGFKYSDAMKAKDGNWTASKLFAFIEDPKGVVPDTKMRFPGVKDAQDRVNLIVFLNEADGTPDELSWASASEATSKSAANMMDSGTGMMSGETDMAADEHLSRPMFLYPFMSPERGRMVFAEKGCVVCHSINGIGGDFAPALDAANMSLPMNPFGFSARMWRGAEAMIALQQEKLGGQVELTGGELGDLIAFVHDADEQKKFSDADIPERIMTLLHEN